MRKRPSLLNDYINFVDTVTSPATKEMVDFKDSLEIIEENGIQPSRLLTASVGLSGEERLTFVFIRENKRKE